MFRTVIFYKTPEGKCPIKDFLDSLDGKVTQKIVWVLSLLEDPLINFKISSSDKVLMRESSLSFLIPEAGFLSI